MRNQTSYSQKSTTGRTDLVPKPAKAVLRGLSFMAPGAAASLAESMFLRPIRLPRPWREDWWATDAEPLKIPRRNGGELAAWAWGWERPTVLLVHGWGGRGLQMGAFAAPLVDAGYRVVAFDAPGHGLSSGRQSSLPEFAEAVADAVSYLGDVHGVVAHSFGAAATTFALAFDSFEPATSLPERLVFVAPASNFESFAGYFSDMTGLTHQVVRRMRRNIEKRFGIKWEEVQPMALASESRQRLLVVHDELDAEVPWVDSEALCKAWPGSELYLSRGLGHHRILRDQSTLERTVRALTED